MIIGEAPSSLVGTESSFHLIFVYAGISKV